MATSTSLFALRAEHFRDQIGKLFHLETRSGAYPMTLIDVWEGAEPLFSGTERRPFTVRFLGPPAARGQGHAMTNLRHPKLGLIEGVFIGPVVGQVPPQFGRGQMWAANFT